MVCANVLGLYTTVNPIVSYCISAYVAQQCRDKNNTVKVELCRIQPVENAKTIHTNGTQIAIKHSK